MATEFCILTPKGRGAIAAIEVGGSGSGELLQTCFRSASGKLLSSFHHNSIVYGNWIVDGVAGEDLVICPLADDRFEIHCHGGNAAIQAIIKSLVKKGGVPTDSPICRDKKCDIDLALAHAPTRRTALVLLAQKELHRDLKVKLTQYIADQDAEPAIELLESLLQHAKFGLHLTVPWSVVFCGRPNVGKSSLINAIVGFERTIVSPTPGTTRDAISHVTSIDGWPIQLTDTAGFRDSGDKIELAGIEIAKSRVADADLVIAILDSSDPSDDDDQFIKALKPDLIVCNKIDVAVREVKGEIPISAIKGDGIPVLLQKISNALICEVPDTNQAVPVSQNQLTHYRTVLSAIKSIDFDLAASLI